MITETFKFINWITKNVQGEVTITCSPDASVSIKMGLAIKQAYKEGKTGAYLTGADLRGADLTGADLRGADLRGADLRGADLTGADLRGADLTGADLRGADLTGADLRDKNDNKITVQKAPIQITGLNWPVTIWDQHMGIGCQFHSLHEWENFSDREIAEMSGIAATRFWKANKDWLLASARSNERSFGPLVPTSGAPTEPVSA